MGSLPDEVIRAHILPLLYKHDIFLFRSVCKSFRRISLEDFAYIKKRSIVNHMENMPDCYEELDRTESGWRRLLYWRRVCVLDKEWNKIYPEIGALTIQEWISDNLNILIEDITGKIILPKTKKLWFHVLFGQTFNPYRLSLPRIRDNTNEGAINDDILNERCPIDGVHYLSERKYVTKEDMIKHLEEHWERECNRYQTEINTFRMTLGLDDISVSLKL